MISQRSSPVELILKSLGFDRVASTSGGPIEAGVNSDFIALDE